MKSWKHITFEQRKLINSLLSKRYRLNEMGDLLSLDPTTISKEIKRNRTLTQKGHAHVKDKVCKHTQRFPYCCNSCHKRYNACPFPQFKYDASSAQHKADRRLVESRQGLDMDEETFNYLDRAIKEGVDNGHSIYHIVHNDPLITVSVPTVYRLINDKKLTTKRMDLPYAVTYKKRKTHKQYEYKENNKIDRTHHTYLDFLAYRFHHPGVFHSQMDFLGHIKTDTKRILTITITDLHFVILFIIESATNDKVIEIFNELECSLTTKIFTKVFPFFLTDRDPCFSNFEAFEASPLTFETRTSIFYCDPYNSSQKGNVEQMNRQLRKFFPKKKSIDHLSQEDIKKVSDIINSTRVASLSGATPYEAFIKIHGQEVLNKIISIR